MQTIFELQEHIQQRFTQQIISLQVEHAELTLEVSPAVLHEVCYALRDGEHFKFAVLLDVCGVDFLHYGLSEWETESSTARTFERGVQLDQRQRALKWDKPRFAVVYHLLSIEHNQRLRLKVFLSEDKLFVDSVMDIWPSADWYEREAFDLFGILFKGHSDLRRILTDYGFIGHPFRKDFPLIGNVEVRYDATLQRVIYEPVNITPRVLVPKVIRNPNKADSTTGAPNPPQDKANG